MLIRKQILSLAAAIALLLVPFLSIATAAADKPNIVLIVADDKYGCLSENFQKRLKNSETMDLYAVFKSMAIAENSV